MYDPDDFMLFALPVPEDIVSRSLAAHDPSGTLKLMRGAGDRSIRFHAIAHQMSDVTSGILSVDDAAGIPRSLQVRKALAKLEFEPQSALYLSSARTNAPAGLSDVVFQLTNLLGNSKVPWCATRKGYHGAELCYGENPLLRLKHNY